MPLFSKYPNIKEINNYEHKWSVVKGDINNAPAIIRINTSAKEWEGHPELNIRLGIAIPLINPQKGKMPIPEENIKLSEIEDQICDEVSKIGPSIHVATITTGEMKEIVFYIKNGKDVANLHKLLMEKIKTHEVQCFAEIDNKWLVYSQLLVQ